MNYPKKTLIIGAFSDIGKNATFGDVQAKEVLAAWLNENKMDFDVIDNVSDIRKAQLIEEIDPNKYDTLIYVCGPFGKNKIYKKFSHCLKIGLDISIINNEDHYLNDSDGLNFIIPRESPNKTNPELAFEATSNKVLVVGLCLVHFQNPIETSRHQQTYVAVKKYFKDSGNAIIKLDTLITTPIRKNPTNITSISQFESLVRKCDVIITSRLHGLVYSLKNNIPVVAIDPILGGGKVTKQANELGWPVIINGDNLSSEDISIAIQKALDSKNIDLIKNIKQSASEKISKLKKQLIKKINFYRDNSIN
jgi:hypothetical protein